MTAARVLAFVLTASTIASAQQMRFDDVVRNLRNPDPRTRLTAVRLLRDAKYPEAIAPMAPLVVDEHAQRLRLQAGEVVEVKSEAEIRLTLDANGKHRNLGFMPEMWEYCGRQLRVLKRVEKICLENEPRTVRRLENTVILEGAFCKGSGIGCDRACFYFWRECWLKRAPGIVSGSDLKVLSQ